MSASYREPTVADLIEQLSALPQHYPVAPLVNGSVGVITGVTVRLLSPGTQETPTVLIGEDMPVDPIVPTAWTRPECNWPKCHRSPNPCFAWCKCQCHSRKPKPQPGGVA